MSAPLFIVVWDDEMGICAPMGWDADCDGAIHAAIGSQPVALFASRAEARKAIRISTAYQRLLREQGKPVNEDFLAGAKCLRIVPCAKREGER